LLKQEVTKLERARDDGDVSVERKIELKRTRTEGRKIQKANGKPRR